MLYVISFLLLVTHGQFAPNLVYYEDSNIQYRSFNECKSNLKNSEYHLIDVNIISATCVPEWIGVYDHTVGGQFDE